MSKHPAPLTDPDCDCRGLPFMPLEVTRLRDSDLVMLSTGDEFKAAVMLWSAAWLQVPAASLPDDDRILAKLSTYPMTEWLAIKEQALRGFVKCSDGRLYHPVIADHAETAFLKRKGQGEKANSRWAKERARKAAAETAPEAMEDAPADAIAHATASAPAMQGTVKGTEKISDAYASSVAAEPATASDIRTAFDAWNRLAGSLGLPKARSLDEGRRKAIRARLSDGGLTAWRQALAAVERSPLCRGETERGWRADLDFVCQPKSWRRLLEGFYGCDNAPAKIASAMPDWRIALQMAREGKWSPSWGPKPSEPGCLAPPPILAEFGFKPAEAA